MWVNRQSNLQSKPRRRQGKFKLFLFLSLLGLMAAGAVYLIWFTPAFEIQAIEVNGGTPPQQEIFKQKTSNNLLFWKPPIKQKDYPQLAKLEVKKDFIERKIVVNLEERKKEMIWCLVKKERCLWIDNTGFAFAEAPFTTGTLVEIKVIEDYSDREIKTGDYTLQPKNFENLKNALTVISELKLPTTEIKIENIDYKEVAVDLSSGPDLYFSLLFDPRFSKSVIEKLKSSSEWSSLRYVDFRVENRAYYSQ